MRVVKVNDEFGITIEGVTSGSREKMDTGAYLTIDATGKLIASDASTADAVMEAVVERKRMVGASLVTAAHAYGHSKTMYEARVKVLA